MSTTLAGFDATMATLQKRKRESTDMPDGRPAPVMDFSNPYMPADDDDTIDNTPVDFDEAFGDQIVDVPAPEESMPPPAAPSQPQGGAGQNVNDTAAAAMAQYHTMTVPQSTEQAFMTQQRAEGRDAQGDASTDAGEGSAQRTGMCSTSRASTVGTKFVIASIGEFTADPAQASPTNGEGSPSKDDPAMTPSRGGKPPVGTEEWHKIRKDNHKEGKSAILLFYRLVLTLLKLSADAARPSTKASTSSQKSCLAAKRTRAAFSDVPCNL